MPLSPDLRTSPFKLAGLFAVVSVLPLVALGWLTWQVVVQDRALEKQRSRERLSAAAATVTRELDRVLQSWERLLNEVAEKQQVSLPDRSVAIVLNGEGVIRHQGVSLAHYPKVASSASSATAAFEPAEALEFQQHDYAAAAAIYRRFSASTHQELRAEALLRLARTLRRQHLDSEAMTVYTSLIALRATPVSGWPAELVGRAERIKLSSASTTGAHEERQQLARVLRDGRYHVDRATFDLFAAVAAIRPAAAGEISSLANAVEGFWPRWQSEQAGRTASSTDSGTFVSVWKQTPAGTVAIAAPAGALLTPIGELARGLNLRSHVSNRDGQAVWGDNMHASLVSYSIAETGLPWVIRLAPVESEATPLAASRQRLIVAAFALMVVVVTTAGCFVFVAVNRELGVARLQSNFVAAVSHEFRTPLTAMRHLTEMLERGAVDRERQSVYFGALSRETRRLQTLVETLLDFARIDAGRRVYQFVPTDPADIVQAVTREVAETAPASGQRIEAHVPAEERPAINADRDALTLALRNLVDNALKYSTPPHSVRVAVGSSGGAVAISVEDHGVGIPVEERLRIFQRFSRGSAARDLNIKGTGIGLTMAKEIVSAHGGRLEVHSRPGRGSVFTMIIPYGRT